MQSPTSKPAKREGTQHLKQYDSLRGLAALIIIATHYLGSLPVGVQLFELPPGAPEPWGLWLLRHTPLGIIVDGRPGVPFFFILSGFVLSLSFLDPARPVPYLPYLVKRLFRLYPAYWVAIATIALVKTGFSPRSALEGFSSFFNHLWTASIDGKTVWQHLPLFNIFKHARLNPPVWTLVIEMRMSIFFPLLVWLFVKFRSRALLVLLALSLWCGFEAEKLHLAKGNAYAHAIAETIQWSGCFMLGIWLAFTRGKWLPVTAAMSRAGKYALLGVGILLYTAEFWVVRNKLFGASLPGLYQPWFLNYVTSLGACIFMVLSLACNSAARALSVAPVHFTGKVSYSLYLWHMVMICALAAALHAWVPPWAIACLAFAGTLAVSALSFHYVEAPFIRWGRIASDALAARLGIPPRPPKAQEEAPQRIGV